MKNLIIILLFISLFASDMRGQTRLSGGTGIEADPYLISTFIDLDSLNVAYFRSGNFYFALTNDIDMDAAGVPSKWSIGDFTFVGHLNGKGYSIRNWTDSANTKQNFMYDLNGSVKNLVFKNVRWYTAASFGAIAAGFFRTLTTSAVLDSIIIDSCDIHNQSTLAESTNWRNAMFVNFIGADPVTKPPTTIRRVAITNTKYLIWRDTAHNPSNMSVMVARPDNALFMEQCYIENVEFYHRENNTDSGRVGWFVSISNASSAVDSIVIKDCYVRNCTTETGAQGITNPSSVSFIRNTSASASAYVRISNCYMDSIAVGSKTKSWVSTYFPIANVEPLGFTNFYVDTLSSPKPFFGPASTHTLNMPTGKTTTEMKAGEATYAGFDFVNVWTIGSSGYPDLRWTVAPPSGIYFRVMNMNPNIEDPVTWDNFTGIGWETNAEFIKFDSLVTPYQAQATLANIQVTSFNGYSFSGGGFDSLRFVATGYNVTPVFDSVYTRPSPASVISDITGSGTRIDPYVLYHASDIDSTLNLGDNKYYALGADIDMSIFGNWSDWMLTRWTENIHAFPNFGLGLDGRGYTISNLNMTVPEGGGPTTFITVGKHTEVGIFQYVKNIIFDKCSLVVTGNPHSQVHQNIYTQQDQYLHRTTMAFIESRNLCENIIFDSCLISVDIGTLESYTNIGFINQPGLGEMWELGYVVAAPDTLQNIGIEGSSVLVDIDTVDVPDRGSWDDFNISMLLTESGTPTNSHIDDLCVMTVDFGPFPDMDTTAAQSNPKLNIGSMTSGSIGRMTDCYVGGVYNWQIDSLWFEGRPGSVTGLGDTWYRNGNFGLLGSKFPTAGGFNTSSQLMKRNIFNGNFTSNVDTVIGVSYKGSESTSGSGAFTAGDSYYNTDSISANIIDTVLLANDYGQPLQVITGINGATTVQLQADSTYKYIILDSKMIYSPKIHPWDFTWANWRKTSGSIPHKFGQNAIADTAWTEGVIDTVGTDSVSVAAKLGAGCGIEKWLDIDTVFYYQNGLDTNSISIITRTNSIDSLDIYYRYAGIDTTWAYLGRSRITRSSGWWDTTTFSYDITTFGIDATKPIIFRASVEEILQVIDTYKEDGSDVDIRNVFPDRRVCQEFRGWNNAGYIEWHRIFDVSCGWASVPVMNGRGIFEGTYGARDPAKPDYRTLLTLYADYADTTTLNFVEAGGRDGCRPVGTYGYNLSWDKWLCYAASIDDTNLVRKDTVIICSGIAVFIYQFATYDGDLWLQCYAQVGGFPDSVHNIFNVTESIQDGRLNLSVSFGMGSVMNMDTGGIALFKSMGISTYEAPADDTWAYGAPDGIGTPVALGSIKRNWFRGIHPKILKYGRIDGERPDSTWIVTPPTKTKVPK